MTKCSIGMASRASERFVAYALRQYVDSRRSAKRLTLPGLLAAYFEKPEWQAVMVDVRSRECLALELDHDTHHKMIPTILGEIWALRSGMNALTLFSSGKDVRKAPGFYGPSLANLFNRSPLLDRIVLGVKP